MERRFLSKLRPYVFLSIVISVALSGLDVFAVAATEPSSREIAARSAVIMDGDKVLYAKNPNFKQPPASTTKLITAMVVLDYLKPNDIVTVSGNAAKLHSPHVALREGERFYVKDLLSLLLMKSVNQAALAFAEAVSGDEREFVSLMNSKARNLGAMDTKFINPHGLPGEGQYITAYDLATIMKKSLDYSLIRETINTKVKVVASLEGRTFVLSNTNKLLWSDGDLIGGKTGFTNAARNCLAFAAEKGDNTLVAALLGDGRRSDLWKDAKFVLSKGYNISESHSSPVIYYSSIADEKVVTASRTPHAGKWKRHRSNRHRADRRSRVMTVAALSSDTASDGGDIHRDYMAKKATKKSKGKNKSKASRALAQRAEQGKCRHADRNAPCRTVSRGGKSRNCSAHGSSISDIYPIVSTDNFINNKS
ncbi:MAG: D-alanyl-D-alanine carboxypeptidase [Nitrospirae bacterium]|nr:D-alanyl-D-alanine carboxypeptidase [Nitrospirota bacterium]